MEQKEQRREEENASPACSFCGKTRDEVGRMIAGPGSVFICNECVDLCNKVIAEEETKSATR